MTLRLLVSVLALFFLGDRYASAQEYELYFKDTGVIAAGAELCFASDLGASSINLLNTWQRLVTEYEDYERGGTRSKL